MDIVPRASKQQVSIINGGSQSSGVYFGEFSQKLVGSYLEITGLFTTAGSTELTIRIRNGADEVEYLLNSGLPISSGEEYYDLVTGISDGDIVDFKLGTTSDLDLFRVWEKV